MPSVHVYLTCNVFLLVWNVAWKDQHNNLMPSEVFFIVCVCILPPVTHSDTLKFSIGLNEQTAQIRHNYNLFQVAGQNFTQEKEYRTIKKKNIFTKISSVCAVFYLTEITVQS